MESMTHLKDHPGLLQQICPHVGSNDVPLSAKTNLNVLPKPTTIVISCGFSITNGLQKKRKYNILYNPYSQSKKMVSHN